MDGGKGVMMSERPSGGGGGGGGGGAASSGGGQAASIGNYKGVMLCNRPFAGAAASHAGGSGGGGAGQSADGYKPFVAGIDKERVHPRGWDPATRERKSTVPVRTNKNSALSKHKKWLRDLQKQRVVAMTEQEETAKQAEARHQRFLEAQQRMRDVVRGLADAQVQNVSVAQGNGQVSNVTIDASAPGTLPMHQGAAMSAAVLSASQKRRLDKAASSKPAWAYTEESKERVEEEEADELLQFAQSLDFEKYMDNIEVVEAMEAAKRQLEALQREQQEEEEAAQMARRMAEREEDGYGGGDYERKEVVPLNADSLRRMDYDNEEPMMARRPVADDAQSIAQSIMSTASESIRSVHSKRSLQAVIERERRTIASNPGMRTIQETDPQPPQKPIAVTMVDASAADRVKKTDVSNLPYMNRNPAI